MLMLMSASWRYYRRRYLGTGLAVVLGVGFCAALLVVASATSRGAGDAVTSSDGASSHLTEAQSNAVVSSLTNGVDVLGTFLAGFAVVALIVAGLVISNTFRIVMSQRGKELAMLRCVGAQRWQVFGATVGEGLLLGLVASALGTVGGIAFGALLVRVISELSPVGLSTSLPGVQALLVPFVAGVLTAAVAVVPAVLRVSAQRPLAAVVSEDLGSAPSDRGSRVRLGVLSVLVGGVGAALLISAAATGRLADGLLGGSLTFLAVLIASPVLVPGVIRAVGGVTRLMPRRLRGGVPASLAMLDSVRNPRRTAMAVAALTIGVTLISMMFVGAASVTATEARAVDRIAPVDVVISGNGLTGALTDEIRRVPRVDHVVVGRGATVHTARGTVEIAALGPAQAAAVVRDPDLRREVATATHVVVPISEQSVVPGNGTARFAVSAGSGTVWVRPVYSSLQSGPLLVAPSVLDALDVPTRPEALYIGVADGADPTAVTSALHALVRSDPHVSVSGGYEKRTTYDRAVRVMVLMAAAMLAVAVVIALVGVGNTLSLSVLERTREHGLMRALGLTTRQLRMLLAHESLMIAATSAIIGIVLGIGYGWIGTITLMHGALSHSPTLVVPVWELLGVAGAALVAGVLASVVPARRAVRLSPVEGLATE